MEDSGLFDFWDPSCRPLEPAVPPEEPGFSGATVMRITTSRGPLAVRGWPPDGLPRQRLESLHRLLEHVAPTVPVAVPVITGDGGRLGSDAGLYFRVMRTKTEVYAIVSDAPPSCCRFRSAPKTT